MLLLRADESGNEESMVRGIAEETSPTGQQRASNRILLIALDGSQLPLSSESKVDYTRACRATTLCAARHREKRPRLTSPFQHLTFSAEAIGDHRAGLEF